MFLLWFIDLRLGHSYIHIVVSDTTFYWLACRPIRSQYAATPHPAYHIPTVPSVRTQRTIDLCIVSHYHLQCGLRTGRGSLYSLSLYTTIGNFLAGWTPWSRRVRVMHTHRLSFVTLPITVSTPYFRPGQCEQSGNRWAVQFAKKECTTRRICSTTLSKQFFQEIYRNRVSH